MEYHLCWKHSGIEKKMKESVSFVRLAYYMYVDSIFWSEENKQFDKMLQNATLIRPARLQTLTDGTKSSKACWRSCWKSSRFPEMTLMLHLGWHPRMTTCGELRAPEWNHARVHWFSTPSRGHHELANPRRTAFHGTIASPLLPDTYSTYYSLLLELLSANQTGTSHVCEGW